MSRRGSPFARLRQRADRDAAAVPAHLRYMTPSQAARRLALDGLDELQREQHARQQAERRAAERERERREQEARRAPWPHSMTGLSEDGRTVLALLWSMGEVVLAGDLARLLPDAEVVDRGVGELVHCGLVEATTTTGADGRPAGESLLRLRRDVELPDPPVKDDADRIVWRRSAGRAGRSGP